MNKTMRRSACFHRLDDKAKQLIGELGSTNIDSVGFRDNWLFVGAKGSSKKSLFEKVKAVHVF